MAGHLPEEIGQQIYGADERLITSGALAPKGRAKRADGGLVVSGRWPWGSATQHSQWIGGGCRVDSEDEDERPPVLFVFFEAEQVSFVDNWDASGLRGSGSTDFEVEEAFVPEGRWVEMPVGKSRIIAPLSIRRGRSWMFCEPSRNRWRACSRRSR